MPELLALLRTRHGLEDMTLTYLQKTVSKGWNWSWAKGEAISRNKFTQTNMEIYDDYIRAIKDVDWFRVSDFLLNFN